MQDTPVWTHACRQAAAPPLSPRDQREADRAGRLIDPAHAQNFLHARHLMRLLAARELRLAEDAVRLEIHDDAPPGVEGDDSVSVSWSRSGPHAFAALLRDGRLGADVEQVLPRRVAPMLDMIATQTERAVMAGLGDGPDALHGFYRLWCAKEAVLKWRGNGFRGGAKTIDIPVPFISGGIDDVELDEGGTIVHLKAIHPSEDWLAVLAFSR
ncbi:4'-phosphopantetheinyl transferase superfamily protein [Henriciella sp.]|uniref:4'-phosphopantetheinyl transferase family protein n=1 Tax=Henriciella sp. TaxID=1968823 RepID=UPI002607B55A|nr:4'-phosphopantetheinyl transferase superfamily protein [Henriciella sp.]